MSRYLLFVMLLLASTAFVAPAAIATEDAQKDAAEEKAEARPADESRKTASEEKAEAVPASQAEPAPEAAATSDADQASEKKDEAVKAKAEKTTDQQGAKMISGMSILGNQEAPKSLVIVPWKSSELGDSLGISTMLDDSRQPIDKEVFMRSLSYYRIRKLSSK